MSLHTWVFPGQTPGIGGALVLPMPAPAQHQSTTWPVATKGGRGHFPGWLGETTGLMPVEIKGPPPFQGPSRSQSPSEQWLAEGERSKRPSHSKSPSEQWLDVGEHAKREDSRSSRSQSEPPERLTPRGSPMGSPHESVYRRQDSDCMDSIFRPRPTT